jgi:HAD superfamily hydrolase (TIGR01509 family)
MNIIIPLGGKGERFSKKGFIQPKPLIPILDKTMIQYVIDHLTISPKDNIFIIYNTQLDDFSFSTFIRHTYPHIHLIQIHQQTKGAVETLYIGIQEILSNYSYHPKCLILDCDTFYTSSICHCFNENTVFYTKNTEETPIYSYIVLNEENTITLIKEKEKISDNANTGAYAFTDIHVLQSFCSHVLEKHITANGEPYTSCVISEMIQSGILFKGVELNTSNVFSLGTPNAVKEYIDNTICFLFDLDGTLVLTEDIYFDVWYDILIKYNIVLNKEIFVKYIQGNNDKYVLNTLLINTPIELHELSKLKDDLFIENIHKLKLIEGVYEFLQQIRNHGYKYCIVTNCNRNVAEHIIQKIGISPDFIISSNDCIYGKPNSEPYRLAIEKYNVSSNQCIVLEDSKTGLLSGKGINPKMLVGIETIYTKEELIQYGVHMSFSNYIGLDIQSFIHNETDFTYELKKSIMDNSTIKIKQIYMDDQKLKGGFIADVISFKMITEEVDSVYSLILKYENTQENNLYKMAKQLDLYEREYSFYVHLSKKIPICIPTYYFLIKRNDKNMGIVLENLIEKKYTLNLDLNKESIDIMLKIIDRMAKMHSAFWNKNMKQTFPFLKTSVDDSFSPFFMNFINDKYHLFQTKWFPLFTEQQRETCNQIYHSFEEIQQRFSEGNHLTFIHGDIKSPNIFYDTNNENEPYFIDWQHCGIGKGVQDLVFFIIESFDITQVKTMLQLGKHYYYRKIMEYGISNYTMEEYEKDIYDAICYIPFFTSIWFGTVPQDELIDKNFPYFFIKKMICLI